MFINYGLELFSDFVNGLVPRNLFELVPDFLEGMQQAVGVVLVKADVQAFAADITLAAEIVLVSADLGNPVVLYTNFQSAEVRSQSTGCFFPFSHISLLCPPF